MTEVLRLQTEHFELSIWCKDLVKRQEVYFKTLIKRGSHKTSYEVRFSPSINLLDNPLIADELLNLTDYKKIVSLPLNEPLFFESAQYQLEWIFTDVGVNQAQLAHKLKAINDCFRFAEKDSKRNIPARLIGTIHTGNNVGWLRLPLHYYINDIEHVFVIAFEVLPTKMDLHTDLKAMYQALDDVYPLWRFSLAEKTEQDASKGHKKGNFPLLWLASFTSLRERFEQNLKVIAYAPHRRLQSTFSYAKADRLKKCIKPRLAENIKEDINTGQVDKRYLIEKKCLTTDTPENRFIKMVVEETKAKLATFYYKLQQANLAPDNQRLSQEFLAEIASWQIPLQKMQTHSFLQGVGEFKGLLRESLVLQQKVGYSAIYQIWQELKFYLDVFANQSTVSMKSIAEIYEVWCFLTLRNILIENFSFKDVTPNKHRLEENYYLEYQLKDGIRGAFIFDREDGLKARLAHEPIFQPEGKDIRSYLVTQKPDILLEVTFPDGKRCIWLFDAKYRIKSSSDRFDDIDSSEMDLVPDDAINQMHRYRDALIKITNLSGTTINKSRPVLGAFSLYPGFFDQKLSDNPYASAIEEVGIGAFPLLPSDDSSGCTWLINFLDTQLSTQGESSSSQIKTYLYAQDAARIPHDGMKQIFHPDLVMIVAEKYIENMGNQFFLKDGECLLSQSFFSKRVKHHIANEIRFLALASALDHHNPMLKQLDLLLPVRDVRLIKKEQIIEVGGYVDNEELYYLFELGAGLRMNNVIQSYLNSSISFTTLSLLEMASSSGEIKEVYGEVLNFI